MDWYFCKDYCETKLLYEVKYDKLIPTLDSLIVKGTWIVKI